MSMPQHAVHSLTEVTEMEAYSRMQTTDRELIRYARRQAAKEQRRRQLRRRISILLFLAGAGILLLFFRFGLRSSASEEDASSSYKYYTSVLVGIDDTMDTIAYEYMDDIHYTDKDAYLSEVRYINHIADYVDLDASVRPGDYLIVPYYSSDFRR